MLNYKTQFDLKENLHDSNLYFRSVKLNKNNILDLCKLNSNILVTNNNLILYSFFFRFFNQQKNS